MPILSVFFGIVVKLYHDDHNPPHFHAEYAEHQAIIDIASGRRLRGRLPRRAAALVEEWRTRNLRDLDRAWQDAQSGRQPRRIRPLS